MIITGWPIITVKSMPLMKRKKDKMSILKYFYFTEYKAIRIQLKGKKNENPSSKNKIEIHRAFNTAAQILLPWNLIMLDIYQISGHRSRAFCWARLVPAYHVMSMGWVCATWMTIMSCQSFSCSQFNSLWWTFPVTMFFGIISTGLQVLNSAELLMYIFSYRDERW